MPEAVYENERWYGLGWRPPALLERSRWTDSDGTPVQMEEHPVEESDNWRLDVNHSTDSEGWLYASVFKHFDYSRPGGRAVRRVSDFVRRRKWISKQDSSQGEGLAKGVAKAAQQVAGAAEAVASSFISPVTQMQGTRVRKQTEMEKRKTAVKVFLGMLTSTIKRRQLWSVTPMDPGAWFFLLTNHQPELVSQQAAVLASSPHVFKNGQEAGKEKVRTSVQPRNLVRDLVCAAVHSRAAYGHAMAAGHLASLYNFALLQTLHQFTFNPVGGASGEANNEAVAALAGIPVEDIKLAEWHNSVMRPCHYLAVDRANHCIVLSIRGSLEIGDVLSDLIAKPLEIFGLLETEGLVHEGMMSAATYVHCNTAPALEALAKTHPGWPLFITGHSMGGGVATILALLMRKGGMPACLGPVRCIAIGPAPVLSRPLAEICNDFVTSVVLGADVVPRISYASVETIFLEFANYSPLGNIGRKAFQTLEGFKDWPASLRPSFRTPALPSLSGLCSLVSLADNDEANAKAVHAAESAAARAAEYSSAVELPEQGQSSGVAGGLEHASSGERLSFEASRGQSSYGISQGLTSSAADAAATRLAFLRAQSQEISKNTEGDGNRENGNSASGDEQVGKGCRASDDYQTAAEVLGTQGKEFQDASGHPEPLYIAGRVLWILPSREQKTAIDMQSTAQLPSELQLSNLGRSSKQENGAQPLDNMQARVEQHLSHPLQQSSHLPQHSSQTSAARLSEQAAEAAWRARHRDAVPRVASAQARSSLDLRGSATGLPWQNHPNSLPGAIRQVPGSEASSSRGEALARSPAQKRPASSILMGSSPTAEQRRSSNEFPSLAIVEEPGCIRHAIESADEDGPDLEWPLSPKRAKSGDQGSLERQPEAQSMAFEPSGQDEQRGHNRVEDAASDAKQKASVPAVLDVDRARFERILLTLEMLQDHLPDSYLQAINQL